MSVFAFRSFRSACLLALAAAFLATPASAQNTAGQSKPPQVIARVQGRPITQADYNRLAGPYMSNLQRQLGASFTPELQHTAMKNVLDELIRREILIIEFNRRKLPLSEADTDALLMQDPYFRTNGKFDEAKFRQFKISPGSNYLQVLPKLRELAGANKVDSLVRKQLMPTNAQVRAEWNKRNDTATLSVLALNVRDQSLEPEATDAEQLGYYQSHPDEFSRPAQSRLRYLKLPLPSLDDTTRAAAETAARDRGRALADSMRAGTPVDSLVGDGIEGPTDTGLFKLPARAIPGLGSPALVLAAVAHADSDTTARVFGPFSVGNDVLVGEIVEHHPKTVFPFDEVRADVKRRADLDKRRTELETEEHAYYDSHRATYALPSIALTRVTVAESGVRTRWPSKGDIERWYKRNGHVLFGDTAGVALPPMSDSLRGVAREHLMAERRIEKAMHDAKWVAGRWRPDRSPEDLAGKVHGAVEHISVVGKAVADSLFPPTFMDSLMHDPELSQIGKIHGPRRFFEHAVVWRVDTLDADYVRPFDQVKDDLQRAVLEERRKHDEAEAEKYFDAHPGVYKTKDKYVLNYVRVPVLSPDSVSVPEEDLRKAYDARISEFREPESVHASHILLMVPPGDEAASKAIKVRADSLRAAIEAGADFAELARTFSQDPGSAPNGGDLGFFPRGRMVRPFEDAAFSLPAGQVSQPIRTQFGWHIIKVLEHRPARVMPLEDVRDRLRLEVAQTRADSMAKEAAGTLRTRLAHGGASDSALAAKYGGVKITAPFALDETLPGVGYLKGLVDDVTTGSLGHWLPDVYKAGSDYLVIRPLTHVPPQPATFAEAKSQVLDDWRMARRQEVLDAKVEKVREGLAAGASFDSIAGPLGGLQKAGPVSRGATFVPRIGAEPRIIEKAFKMDLGTVSDTIHTANGVAWMRVDERGARKGASFAKERAELRNEMLAQRYREWVDRKRKTLKVEILRADLK